MQKSYIEKLIQVIVNLYVQGNICECEIYSYSFGRKKYLIKLKFILHTNECNSDLIEIIIILNYKMDSFTQ